jgi:serpin B
MKNLLITGIFALGFAGLFSCNDDPIDPELSDIELSAKSAAIVEADNQFGFDLIKKISAAQAEEKNLMVSPLSVSLALGMVYNGADGTTKTQMEAMLHKSGLSADDINQSYKNLVSALASHDPKVDLSISNAIFYRNDFTVKQPFITTNQTYYDANVSALDFSNQTQTLKTVNGWVNEKTHGKIPTIINQVNDQDVMYLLNAVYFNGQWKYRFNSSDTDERVFFLSNGTSIKVPTMMVEKTFNYINTDQFELLEMPYGSGKFSMLIFLPSGNHSPNDVIAQLSPANLSTWISNMSVWNKKVFMPKLEFSYSKSLIETLSSLGMIDAFKPGIANFSGIANAELFISDVMHKTYLKVDERGTEAAAVTGVTFGVTSVGPTDPDIFAVDHPFVFAIREADTNAILFIGKVMNPSLKE